VQERIASGTFVSALLRLAAREGGFGAVLAKGDANAGAILILLSERGSHVQVLERLLQPDGRYAWDSPLAGRANAEELDKFLSKRRRFDPDSWIIELDTASAERFAAEIRALD